MCWAVEWKSDCRWPFRKRYWWHRQMLKRKRRKKYAKAGLGIVLRNRSGVGEEKRRCLKGCLFLALVNLRKLHHPRKMCFLDLKKKKKDSLVKFQNSMFRRKFHSNRLYCLNRLCSPWAHFGTSHAKADAKGSHHSLWHADTAWQGITSFNSKCGAISLYGQGSGC